MKIVAAVSGLGFVLVLTTACGSSGGSNGATSTPPTGSSSSSSSAPAVKSVEAAAPSAAGSSAPATSGGSPVATAPGGAFSVVLPSGWTQDRQEASALHAVDVYLGPVTDAFAANLNVVGESDAGLTLEAYRQRSVANLRSVIAISKLSGATSTTVGGDDALQYSFEDTQQGKRLRQRQTVVLHGGQAYTITYTATTGGFAASSAAAQGIIASWRWGS